MSWSIRMVRLSRRNEGPRKWNRVIDKRLRAAIGGVKPLAFRIVYLQRFERAEP